MVTRQTSTKALTSKNQVGLFRRERILHQPHAPLTRLESRALTNDGQNDNNKVKNVPTNGEEITAEGKYLDEAFGSEDDDEDQVDVIEDGLHASRLFISLDHHGYHVEDNEHHDGDVKGLLGHQVKEESLQNVLDENVFMVRIQKGHLLLDRSSIKIIILPLVLELASVAFWIQVSSSRCSTSSALLS